MEDGEVRYNCKQLLDLLSIYEGELQAREVLIETLQRQQDPSLQGMSSSVQSTILNQKTTILNQKNSHLHKSPHNDLPMRCASCGNRMLHSAKLLQIQKDCDRKLNKAINLMNKRYAKINLEIELKERRLEGWAKNDGKYIKSLESERYDCHEQLKTQHNEFADLQEKKTEIEEKFTENDERTKQIILYLLQERKQLFEHLNELRKQINTSPTAVAGPSSSTSTTLDESQTQINALREENRQLQNQLALVQTEKGSLQKRLDYLLKDLQQSAFHQHFQFLQPKGSAEKELIVIGNGLISPSEHFQGPNRIRNSSSFPQSFGNDLASRFSTGHEGNCAGRSRMPQQFPTNHFEQRQSGAIIGGPIPLMASNSTMIMPRLPPPVPRISAQQMPTNPLNQQQQYGRPSNEQQYPQQRAVINSTNIQLGQPQTVITRRSTSLPRRIVTFTAVSPASKQHSLQHSRKEPSAEHFFYHQQQSQGIVTPMMEDGSHQKQQFVNNFI